MRDTPGLPPTEKDEGRDWGGEEEVAAEVVVEELGIAGGDGVGEGEGVEAEEEAEEAMGYFCL